MWEVINKVTNKYTKAGKASLKSILLLSKHIISIFTNKKSKL